MVTNLDDKIIMEDWSTDTYIIFVLAVVLTVLAVFMTVRLYKKRKIDRLEKLKIKFITREDSGAYEV